MKLLIWQYVAFSVLLSCKSDNDDGDLTNIIALPSGSRLKGALLESHYSKKPYVEFRGLPYAYPPVGDLRFKPTKLVDDDWEDWSHKEDATKFGNICPQLDPWYDPSEVEDGSWEELSVLGDEDCLFANVATSNTKPETLLPVLVWIHGGNFQTESGGDYGVAKLMDHDIVVVTFNYRIGILGFFNAEDGVYNGNQGLKDQALLLKWVKKNIHHYGGDPDKITLAGSNAGGVSVHLHLLSNFSQGLFHRAIIQSGTAISPWVLMRDPQERLKKLAKFLKCGNDTDIVTCVVQKDATSIVQKTPKMAEWFLDPMVPFGPSIEMFGEMKDRFLAKDPYNILSEGNYWGKDIPVVMGVNSHEGLMHAMDIGHQAMLRMVFNREWFGAAPISLYYKKSAIDPRSVSEAVRNFYFPLPHDSNEKKGPGKMVDKDYQFDNLTNLYSDRHFFVPLHHSAKLMGRSNQLYLYWFDYVSDQSIHGLYGYNSSYIFGSSHYDQLQYLFVTPFFNQTEENEHTNFEKQFIDGIYTFINEGSPFAGRWKKVTEEMIEGTLIYNRIGKITSEPHHVPEQFTSRVEFWKGLMIMENDKASFVNDFIDMQESTPRQKDEL